MRLSPIASCIVSQIEAGKDVHAIVNSLQQQGVNDDDIDTAFEEAERYERQKGERLINEAKVPKDLRRQPRPLEQKHRGKTAPACAVRR
jgi:SOS response regulatory protein OraA/RecX